MTVDLTNFTFLLHRHTDTDANVTQYSTRYIHFRTEETLPIPSLPFINAPKPGIYISRENTMNPCEIHQMDEDDMLLGGPWIND